MEDHTLPSSRRSGRPQSSMASATAFPEDPRGVEPEGRTDARFPAVVSIGTAIDLNSHQQMTVEQSRRADECPAWLVRAQALNRAPSPEGDDLPDSTRLRRFDARSFPRHQAARFESRLAHDPAASHHELRRRSRALRSGSAH